MSRRLRIFQRTVWNYYKKYRRNLPWRPPVPRSMGLQGTSPLVMKLHKDGAVTDPYKILVSEIMLQQTQVSRVLKKYLEFIKAFPNFRVLKEASLSEILSVWQGMGYNRRAIALKKSAEIVGEKFKGKLPDTEELLSTLPGIGKATAGSIVVFAFNKPSLFIETNIRRTFIHHFFREKEKIDDSAILPLLLKTLPSANPREWYYALMDYGSMLGVTVLNPNRKSRGYRKQTTFQGSDREVRGKILKFFLERKRVTLKELRRVLRGEQRTERMLHDLIREGFIMSHGSEYHLT